MPVGLFDAIIRTFYGVCEFTDDPAFGFEPEPTNFSLCRRLYALGESCTLWALTRAFNPAAVSRQPFLRDHHELWIFPSRTFRALRPSAEVVRDEPARRVNRRVRRRPCR
jgi:hypothetical protein